jgi:hypothetical protein
MTIAATSLSPILQTLAAHSRGALQAAQATDDALVRQHVDAMRSLRALLKRCGADAAAPGAAPAQGTRDVDMSALQDIERAQQFVGVWCQRYLQMFSRDALLQTLDGCHALLDAELPATWDWGSDLLICVVADLAHPLLQALRARGQQRLLLVALQPESAGADWPPQWRVLSPGQRLEFSPWQAPPIGQANLLDTLQDERSEPLMQQLKQGVMSHLANVATFRSFGRLWLEQGLRNLPRIARHPSWTRLAAVARGRPAVIVAPGPSLARNVQALHACQDQVLIIATAQAILALQAANISPHVIVVVDPQNMGHYFEGYRFAPQTVLAVGRTCAPSNFELPARHFVTLPVSSVTDGWMDQILDDVDPLDAGGSVSITALSMAIRWGCSSVALIGQDLALQDGQQYAPGTADAGLTWQLPTQGSTAALASLPQGLRQMQQAREEPSAAQTAQLMQLPGYHGGLVWTKQDYYVFHSHFESIARELQADRTATVSLYNCTEGGASIQGYQPCALRDWLQTHANPAAVLDWEAQITAIEQQQHSASAGRLLAWKQRTQDAIERGLQAAGHCRRCLAAAPSPTSLQTLQQYEQALLQSLDELEFLSIAYQQAILDALATIHLAKDLPSSLHAEAQLITLIEQALQSFSPVLDSVQAGGL